MKKTKKEDILNAIKSLILFSKEETPETPETPEDVVKHSFKRTEIEDGVNFEKDATLEYSGELEVGTEVKVYDEEGALIDPFTGEIEMDDKMLVIVDSVVTEIKEKEAETDSEDEDDSEDFTTEFSSEVLTKITEMNKQVTELMENFSKVKDENEALTKEINELKVDVEKFSKQEVDEREDKKYTSREEFLKNPTISFD